MLPARHPGPAVAGAEEPSNKDAATLLAVGAPPEGDPRRIRVLDKVQVSMKSADRRAFSLLEIIAVLAIVSILVLFIVPNYGRIVASAQEAICASNMRQIRVALGQYLADHENIWPQAPVDGNEQQIQQFWFATLKPYDISEKTWRCPTIASKLGAEGLKDAGMHYAPTAFDATPTLPTVGQRSHGSLRWPMPTGKVR